MPETGSAAEEEITATEALVRAQILREHVAIGTARADAELKAFGCDLSSEERGEL